MAEQHNYNSLNTYIISHSYSGSSTAAEKYPFILDGDKITAQYIGWPPGMWWHDKTLLQVMKVNCQNLYESILMNTNKFTVIASGVGVFKRPSVRTVAVVVPYEELVARHKANYPRRENDPTLVEVLEARNDIIKVASAWHLEVFPNYDVLVEMLFPGEVIDQALDLEGERLSTQPTINTPG